MPLSLKFERHVPALDNSPKLKLSIERTYLKSLNVLVVVFINVSAHLRKRSRPSLTLFKVTSVESDLLLISIDSDV